MKRSREFERVVAVLQDNTIFFRFEDGSNADAPYEVVSNSRLLRDALSDALDGNGEVLQAPKGVLQSWLQCRDQNQPFTVQLLQVRT